MTEENKDQYLRTLKIDPFQCVFAIYEEDPGIGVRRPICREPRELLKCSFLIYQEVQLQIRHMHPKMKLKKRHLSDDEHQFLDLPRI